MSRPTAIEQQRQRTEPPRPARGANPSGRTSRAAELVTSGVVPLPAGSQRGSSGLRERRMHQSDGGPDGGGVLPFSLTEVLVCLRREKRLHRACL